jgi:ribokinase
MKFDVVGFGAMNLDKLFTVEKIAKTGEEVPVLAFKLSGGGSAANAMVGLARLGLKTSYIGKVAKDREGDFLLDEFRAEGVDIKGIKRVKVSDSNRSGTVMGYIEQGNEKDRALYIDPGINDQLDFKDIDVNYVSDTEFLHLSSFVAEKPFNAQKQLVAMLSGVKICFDPGHLYAKKGLAALTPIIRRSFAIFPNDEEVRLLTGHDYKEGAKVFLDLGAEIVAVKRGRKGCYVTNGKESHSVDPYMVDAVDTTGAGDAFCAGFIYGLAKGKDLSECGKLGNFVASRCVIKRGARTGLPRLADLKDL